MMNMMTHPLWLAQNLMTHPFVRVQNLVNHPPPPPILSVLVQLSFNIIFKTLIQNDDAKVAGVLEVE